MFQKSFAYTGWGLLSLAGQNTDKIDCFITNYYGVASV